jgi:hypothetical protein
MGLALGGLATKGDSPLPPTLAEHVDHVVLGTHVSDTEMEQLGTASAGVEGVRALCSRPNEEMSASDGEKQQLRVGATGPLDGPADGAVRGVPVRNPTICAVLRLIFPGRG